MKYSQFVSLVNDYEKQIYETWSQTVNEKVADRMEYTLLKRQEIQIVGLPRQSEIELDEQGCYIQKI